MLEVFLLGAPRVLLNGEAVKIARRKSRALMYYLAAHPQPLSREHLLAFFWPDVVRASALSTLRTTLYGLRKILGAEIQITEDQVSLGKASQIDIRRFEEVLTNPESNAPALEAALDLYQGDFLSDFSLLDSAEFEEWIVTEREHLRRMAMRGWSTLSAQYETAGDLASALRSLERALSFDPLQEDLQREAIRLAYLSGDRPGAIRRYDTLRRLLDEQMGVPPMQETRKLYDSVLNDTLGKEAASIHVPVYLRRERGKLKVVESQPADLPFTGREAELESLGSLSGSGKLVLIEGEAGIGKTRLAEEFMRLSYRLPVAGAALELEQSLPYQPVIEALRGLINRPEWPGLASRLELLPLWWAEISRLVPELYVQARVEAQVPSAEEARLWEGIYQFLTALARLHPPVFFLDDLQWADASTLALLNYLVRRSDGQVYYLATMHSVEPRSPLASLIQTLTRLNRLVRLPLQRLLPADVDTIARRISPKDSARLADWLAHQSEGNPFILVEIVRHLHGNGLLRPDGQIDLSSLPGAPVVPQTVYSLVQGRLEHLSEAARRVLDAGVAAGRTFDFEVAYRAAGLSESAALDALDELRQAGLVHLQDGQEEEDRPGFTCVFDHTLTMEVAYREMGEARHRLLHRRVAEAMEKVYRGRLEPVAGMVAFHYLEGGDLARAALFARQAAENARRLAAWKEAARFYEMALAAETSQQGKKEILVELGWMRFRSGEAVRASETFQQALALLPPDHPEADQIRLALANTLLTQARFGEVIDLVRQVRAGNLPEIARQAQFLWGTALSLEGADLVGAQRHLEAAEAACSAECNPLRLAEIRFELGSIAAQLGDLDKAIHLYNQALEASRQALEDPATREEATTRLILSYNNLAYHLLLKGDQGALQYAQIGMDLARDTGALPLQTYLLSTLGEIALAAGKVEEAESNFREGLSLAERLSMPERIAGLTANLGLVARERGQPQLAIHLLSTALSQADALRTLHLAALIRIWLAPLLPGAEARQRLAEASAIAESSHRKQLQEQVSRLERELA